MTDLCQCSKCGRMHRLLGNPPWRERVSEIASRIRPTICETYGTNGMTVEGRILVEDFNELMRLLDVKLN